MPSKNPLVIEKLDEELGSPVGVRELVSPTDSVKTSSVQGKEEEITNDFEEVTVELRSTNDLSYPVYPVVVQLFSLAVQILQLVIMVTLIDTNSKKIYPIQPYNYRIGQIFVFFYAVVTLTTGEESGLSTLLKADVATWAKMPLAVVVKEMCGGEQTEDIRESRMSLAFSDFLIKSANEPLPKQVVGVLFGGFMAVLCGFASLLYAGVFIVYQLTGMGTFTMTPNPIAPITPLRIFLRTCGVLAEACVIITTAVAMILVSNQQPDLLNILFNFCGVQIVSSFDEVMMNVLPKMHLKVMTAPNYNEIKPTIDEVSVQYGFVVATGVILVCSLLFTIDWPDPNDD